MIYASDTALAKIRELIGTREAGVRMWIVDRTPGGAAYALDVRQVTDGPDSDCRATLDGVPLIVPLADLGDVRGAFLDYVDVDGQRGFRISGPSVLWENPRARKVQEILDRHVNPSVAVHGGEVELAGLEGSTAFVRMRGGCHGCAMANSTLKNIVERTLREYGPDVTAVVDVTDHDCGRTPFFR